MTNGTIELTEIERLKMENYALKFNMLQSQINTIVAERAAFIKVIEADHPGYVWTDQNGLVAQGIAASAAGLHEVK